MSRHANTDYEAEAQRIANAVGIIIREDDQTYLFHQKRGKHGPIRTRQHVGGTWWCNCDRYETLGHCLHKRVSEILLERRGTPKPAQTRFPRDEAAYTRGQAAEWRDFDTLLRDACADLPTAPPKRGNQALHPREEAWAAVRKVHSGLSGRRAMALMRHGVEIEALRWEPHEHVASRFFNKPYAQDMLDVLIARSALPLASIETQWGIDSTGFRTQGLGGLWRLERYDEERKITAWRKCHALVGLNTKVVGALLVTPHRGKLTGDISQFAPLLERAKDAGYTLVEIIADGAYCGRQVLTLAEELGATPLIPFKKHTMPARKTSHGTPGGSAWWRAWHYFNLHKEQFYERYHKRSNVEACFSTIKRKYGETLKSTRDVAADNELRARIIAHNLATILMEVEQDNVTMPTWASALA